MSDKTRRSANLVSDDNIFVDIVNDRVGIGTSVPTSKLDVFGDGNFIGVVTAFSFSGNASSASYAITSGISTYATTAGIATYASTAGISTSVIGGISSITGLNVSGLSTFSGITTHTTSLFGTQASFNGIVTASQLDLTANATTDDSVFYLSGLPLGTSSKNGIFGIGQLGFGDTNIIANFTHNTNSYAQIVLQNLNSGSSSSSDFIVNNDRTAGTTYYGDFGINGTTFTGGGPFGDADGTYLYSSGGSLSIGTNDAIDFRVATGNDVATPVTRITVKGTTGFVGIGTSTPTEVLQVQGNLSIKGVVSYGSSISTTTTVSQVEIHSQLSATEYRTVEYTIQATQGTNFHATKILAIHDGSIVYNSEYGAIYNNGIVGTFDVDILGGNIRLLVTPSSVSTTNYIINFTATKI